MGSDLSRIWHPRPPSCCGGASSFLKDRNHQSPVRDLPPRARESGHSRVSVVQGLPSAGTLQSRWGSGCLTATCPRWGRGRARGTQSPVGTSGFGAGLWPPPTFCPSPGPLLSRRNSTAVLCPLAGAPSDRKARIYRVPPAEAGRHPVRRGAQGLTCRQGAPGCFQISREGPRRGPGGRTQPSPAATRANPGISLSLCPFLR